MNGKLIEKVFELDIDGLKIFVFYGFKGEEKKLQVINVMHSNKSKKENILLYCAHSDLVTVKFHKTYAFPRYVSAQDEISVRCDFEVLC